MDAQNRTARIKMAAIPAAILLALAGWITVITVGIADEPDPHSGASSQEGLAKGIDSAIRNGNAEELTGYFSASAGDDYGTSLLDQLSGPGSVHISWEQADTGPFITLRKGRDCVAFEMQRVDGSWVADAVPRIQGCRA
ncbi:hypothetical protein [Streptomyces sp. NPDC059611]|uniref:hypothetical protein n=1 Tax=Streptomyces sp. NPDC059611 TaxID=3346884 RepID=UPI00369E3EE8